MNDRQKDPDALQAKDDRGPALPPDRAQALSDGREAEPFSLLLTPK